MIHFDYILVRPFFIDHLVIKCNNELTVFIIMGPIHKYTYGFKILWTLMANMGCVERNEMQTLYPSYVNGNIVFSVPSDESN